MENKFVDYSDVNINDGFWQKKQKQNAEVTVYSIYDRFKETGRFDALNLSWHEGEKNKPHIFWDSDFAKWAESVSYILNKSPDKKLQALLDEMIDVIEKNQEECGYYNIWYKTVEPYKRFTRREDHELYCAGHLIEAGAAYYEATGKDKLLKIASKYADYIEKVFVTDKSASYSTPGHPEIELALVRLYEVTGEKRYLDLSKHFIDERGKDEQTVYDGWATARYSQSHLPVRRQSTAEGHAVRGAYLYSGMADIARYYNDEELKNACKNIFENIVERRMYITGGIGSGTDGEAFTVDYDLPNLTAYSESCAAIALMFFAKRMLLLECKSEYADIIERILYNGFLSSISLDGKKFFYENPLEICPRLIGKDKAVNNGTHYPKTQRSEVFDCSCCPPNVSRMLGSLGGYIYSVDGKSLYVHQFISSQANLGNGYISQKTDYPRTGAVKITADAEDIEFLAVRLPCWCKNYSVNVNGQSTVCKVENGHIMIKTIGEVTVDILFDIKSRFEESNPLIAENNGKVALTRGPVVYCIEAVDNGNALHSLSVDTQSALTEETDEATGFVSVTADGFRRESFDGLYRELNKNYVNQKIKFIPYFAFANRGESEMLVWVRQHSI